MVGFININKPVGKSSAFAVGRVKKLFGCPCGHMGTLDPMASGVLPVGIGKASRLFPYLLDKEKTYVAEFTFGYETDTLDDTGKKVSDGGRIPARAEIENALPFFIGNIEQIPPKFSAKCVDGKRGYELARKGVDFTLSAKTVEISDFRLTEAKEGGAFSFEISCKGGTYIRSLCRDLAHKLGTKAVMTGLTRTKSGAFDLNNAMPFNELSDLKSAEKYIIPADSVVDFEKLFLDKKTAEKIINGLFDDIGVKDGTYRVYNETAFLGIGVAENGVLKIKSYVR
ncbi:MAG: tRNA pseudouridine(55) synthase TruB [Clostridia bacterium]|nr:tRNA pseudouridine(55) synthase TruB [Clostridia bacterium]